MVQRTTPLTTSFIIGMDQFIIYENGDMEYYIYGMKHTKKEFDARIADIKLNQNATSIPKNI